MRLFKYLMIATYVTLASGLQAAPQKKILVVLSGVDYVRVQEGGRHPTGYFLSELAIPLAALVQAGYEPVFATPNGRPAAMDKVSDQPRWFKNGDEYRHAKGLLGSLPDFDTPRTLRSFQENELKTFDGIFLPGGHAPMEDLFRDRDLGRILAHFHSHAKPTALICHAPIALLSTQRKGAPWIYTGYQLTVFSKSEEKQEEEAGHLDGHLLYYVDEALSQAGAQVTSGPPWESHVVQDRELITGQNPMSDERFTEVLLKALEERR
jgi:putative intracellular protease/amidase